MVKNEFCDKDREKAWNPQNFHDGFMIIPCSCPRIMPGGNTEPCSGPGPSLTWQGLGGLSLKNLSFRK